MRRYVYCRFFLDAANGWREECLWEGRMLIYGWLGGTENENGEEEYYKLPSHEALSED